MTSSAYLPVGNPTSTTTAIPGKVYLPLGPSSSSPPPSSPLASMPSHVYISLGNSPSSTTTAIPGPVYLPIGGLSSSPPPSSPLASMPSHVHIPVGGDATSTTTAIPGPVYLPIGKDGSTSSSSSIFIASTPGNVYVPIGDPTSTTTAIPGPVYLPIGGHDPQARLLQARLLQVCQATFIFPLGMTQPRQLRLYLAQSIYLSEESQIHLFQATSIYLLVVARARLLVLGLHLSLSPLSIKMVAPQDPQKVQEPPFICQWEEVKEILMRRQEPLFKSCPAIRLRQMDKEEALKIFLALKIHLENLRASLLESHIVSIQEARLSLMAALLRPQHQRLPFSAMEELQ